MKHAALLMFLWAPAALAANLTVVAPSCTSWVFSGSTVACVESPVIPPTCTPPLVAVGGACVCQPPNTVVNGVCTVPAPTACVGYPYTSSLPFKVGNSGIIPSPAGFGPGSTWVVSFRTPPSGSYVVMVNYYEYGGPTCGKEGALTAAPCGTELGYVPAMYPTLRATIGKAATGYPTLAHNTTYHFWFRTSCAGGTAIEMTVSPF